MVACHAWLQAFYIHGSIYRNSRGEGFVTQVGRTNNIGIKAAITTMLAFLLFTRFVDGQLFVTSRDLAGGEAAAAEPRTTSSLSSKRRQDIIQSYLSIG